MRSFQPSAEALPVAARASRLSQIQVEEVRQELCAFWPGIRFDCLLLETVGDKDQATSLKSLDKTDFFTREIDSMLLQGRCRIAIHSAKDLPEPLPEGLALVAVTRGVDASDALVFRSGGGLAALPPGSRVGASSARREEAVLALRPDLRMVDIRGTIEKRLALLHERAIDALVVAEAALIRLGLTHLTRIALPGPTAPLQGQLAVVARSGDIDMERLFSLLDARCERKSSM